MCFDHRHRPGWPIALQWENIHHLLNLKKCLHSSSKEYLLDALILRNTDVRMRVSFGNPYYRSITGHMRGRPTALL